MAYNSPTATAFDCAMAHKSANNSATATVQRFVKNFLNSAGNEDLLQEIFTYLPLHFESCLSCVCHRFKVAANDMTWKPNRLLYAWGARLTGHLQEESEPRLLQRFYSPNAAFQIKTIACTNYGTFALSRTGRIWRWGSFRDTSKRPLGSTCEDGAIATPQELTELQGVVDIAASCSGYYHARESTGHWHAAALTEEGEFYQWGLNSAGQLFLGEEEVQGTRAYYSHPTKVVCFKERGERVLKFSCGVVQTVVHVEAVGSDGGFRTWEKNAGGVRELEELRGVLLQQVACGGWFTCAVDGLKRLWTWGDPSGPDFANGSLIGRSRVTAPMVVDIGEPVRSVAASTYSALCISECGRCFTWGDHDGGALGHEAYSDIPCPLELPHGVRVTDASLAYTNGGVVTENGDLYVWGGKLWEGGVGQLTGGTYRGHLKRVEWQGLAKNYTIESLGMGHGHAFLVARKSVTEKKDESEAQSQLSESESEPNPESQSQSSRSESEPQSSQSESEPQSQPSQWTIQFEPAPVANAPRAASNLSREELLKRLQPKYFYPKN